MSTRKTLNELANEATYSYRLDQFGQPTKDIIVENAAIVFRNFSGAPTQLNPEGGKRSFCLVVTEEVANTLRDAGWNVKFRAPRDENEDGYFYTQVNVNMDSKYPPRVVLISTYNGNRVKRELKGNEVQRLDKLRLEGVDLCVHPYEHGRPGPYKVKGYLSEMAATQAEERSFFGGKYDDIPESSNASQGLTDASTGIVEEEIPFE